MESPLFGRLIECGTAQVSLSYAPAVWISIKEKYPLWTPLKRKKSCKARESQRAVPARNAHPDKYCALTRTELEAKPR